MARLYSHGERVEFGHVRLGGVSGAIVFKGILDRRKLYFSLAGVYA